MAEVSEPKPVILAIDDEIEVLRAVQRDLRTKYAADYRIVGAQGGPEAINTIDELALRGDPLALIVADQRMPDITGVEVIAHAITHYPSVRRVLLTAYADTEAAISAINEVGLDQYIMKPWDPPEEHLYPILDDLLDDWSAHYRPQFRGVRIVATEWSRDAFDLRSLLAKNQIPYRFIKTTDPEGQTLIEVANAGKGDFPLVCFPDGEPLRKPSEAELASRVGLRSRAAVTTYDVAIVGAGPAGLAAAVYGASEGLSTVLIEKTAPGGQAGESSLIENYLGFPKGISGADLARRASSQASRFGAEIVVPASVSSLERHDPYKTLHLDDGSQVTCKAMVISSGVSYRRLEAEGLDDLVGAGVYYGASRNEADRHRDQPMFVVGGGNSAGQAALFLSRFSNDVTILLRRDDPSPTMSQYLIDNISGDPNVSFQGRSEVVAARGDTNLESVEISGLDTDEVTSRDAGALFIFIGQKPQTEWLNGLVDLDERGFILTGYDLAPVAGWTAPRDPLPLETSVPGVFAAGDVRHGSIRRVAGATGEGATAIRFVHTHLADL